MAADTSVLLTYVPVFLCPSFQLASVELRFVLAPAQWLHRAIAGPKSTTEPQAGLYTEARAGPLAQLVAKAAADPKADPLGWLDLFSSSSWAFANNTAMPDRYDWLEPPVRKTVNGRADAFSQRLGQECQPFAVTPPDAPLFDAKKVAIVGNGRCASSCSIFSVRAVGVH